MNRDRPGSGAYVSYVQHTSTSAAMPFVESTSAPGCLAEIVRDRMFWMVPQEPPETETVPLQHHDPSSAVKAE
jgi:hypothetical protein